MSALCAIGILVVLFAIVSLLTGRTYTPKTFGWTYRDNVPGMFYASIAFWFFIGAFLLIVNFSHNLNSLRDILYAIYSPVGMTIFAIASAGVLAWKGTVALMLGTVSYYWLGRRQEVSRSDNATFFYLGVFFCYVGAFMLFATGIYVAQLTPEELRSSSFSKHMADALVSP
ncbi:MAG: hypothetical protein IT291_03695 [Deltaproteobacteria bacterium]|nr:hypothetical protein [Deltaproteobacteria bacterium]